MKIQDAKKAYVDHLDMLQERKRTLAKYLEEGDKGAAGPQSFDRVEISRELSVVESQYTATKNALEGIAATETAIYNRETAKQQSEALSEAADEMAKIMEIYRRIASGGRVPRKDEQKLMEYSHELYMAAKAAALLQKGEGEEYDSLWEEEEGPEEESRSAGEIAAQTEIAVPAPEAVAAAAAPEAVPTE